ncbi:MAG: type II toxin-antitoxin system prevent-host-death family antitoxin [Verrucomicrobiota bacterium]
MKEKVNIYEIKTNLSRYLNKVKEEGETYIICKNGEPVAELTPCEKPRNPLIQNPELKGKVEYLGDICAPLDDGELQILYGSDHVALHQGN